MAKLQPNFSWQKYEGKEEDQKEQFQYQLQKQHILVANAVNATIVDLSFFTAERQTSFVWINNKYIFTKTIPTSAWTSAGTINTIPLGIVGNFSIIDWTCWISNGTLSSSTTLLLPNVDVTTAANEISIVRNGTNVILTSGGTDYSAYTGYLTVYYIKN
jgi:hypothetical protein